MTTTISGSNGIVFPDDTSMQTGQQACKAWVNFNGDGVVAIRAGYNVASITDSGVGRFSLNFTNALVDSSYVMTSSAGNDDDTTATGRAVCRDGIWTTTQCQIRNKTVTNNDNDDSYIGVAIFSN
jgi:exopolysaccharide biosynthesis protein